MTAGELAALTESLAATPIGGADARSRAAARRSLRERGLLVSAPLEDSEGVASEIASPLAAMLWPDRVCILQLTRRPQGSQTVHIGITSSAIGANRIDAEGEHVLVELESISQVVDLLAIASGLPASLITVDVEPRLLEQLLPMAQVVAVLLTARMPATSPGEIHSVCWLVVNGSVWLAEPSPDPSTACARPIGAGDLRVLLAQSIQTA